MHILVSNVGSTSLKFKLYRMPEEEAERYTRIRDLVTRLDRDAIMEEL